MIKDKTKFSFLQLRIMLLKRYFDYGFGMTNYFKYFIYLSAAKELIVSQSVGLTIILLLIWGVFSFCFGWYMYNHGWHAAEQEVINLINPFVKGVRKSLNIR